MNEIQHGILVIKMYAWKTLFGKMVNQRSNDVNQCFLSKKYLFQDRSIFNHIFFVLIWFVEKKC